MFLTRGVHRSSWVRFVPNTDPTQIIRVEENVARNQPGEVVGFFGSGLVGFGSQRVGFEFITREEIWPDPTRSGRNLAESVEIWTKSGRIWRDIVEIWPDPSRSSLDFIG